MIAWRSRFVNLSKGDSDQIYRSNRDTIRVKMIAHTPGVFVFLRNNNVMKQICEKRRTIQPLLFKLLWLLLLLLFLLKSILRMLVKPWLRLTWLVFSFSLPISAVRSTDLRSDLRSDLRTARRISKGTLLIIISCQTQTSDAIIYSCHIASHGYSSRSVFLRFNDANQNSLILIQGVW